MKKSVVIIGGGIAGLTAAFKLQNAGIEVTLLEKSSRLGGAMHSIEEDGYLLEIGPNTILETSPKVTEVVKELGIEQDKIYANKISKIRYIVRNKIPVPLPMSPPAFIKSPLFKLSSKFRLLKEPFIKAWDNSYEEALSHFVIRRLGQDFLDYAINPFVAGVYAGDPDNLSVKHGFPKLYALEQKYGSLIKGQIKGAKERKKRNEESKQSAKMFSFTHGLKTLPEAFEKILGPAIHKDSQVIDISQLGGEWSVTFIDRQDNNNSISANVILFAGKANELNNITLGNEKFEDFNLFKDIYYPPVSGLALGFKREDIVHPLDGFGMLIPKVEGFQILGTLFSSTLFPNRAPDNHVLFTVFIGGSRQPENALKSKTKLIDMAVNDLDILLGINGKPTFIHHVFWNEAIPQYEIGYGQFKDKIVDLEERYPGLFFTGNYRNGISVADTMVNGTEITEQIIQYFTD